MEGQFLCPEVPQALIDATKTFRKSGRTPAALETWRRKRTEIQRYAAKPHGKPDKDGYQRFKHPVRKDGKPTCNPNRQNAPTFCKQGSITVAPAAEIPNGRTEKYQIKKHVKLMQPLAYGTEHWASYYGTGRNIIESFNAFLKDEGKQAFGIPSRRRIRGYAAQALISSVLVAAANLRKVHEFLQNVARKSENGRKKRVKRRDSRTTIWSWHPKGPIGVMPERPTAPLRT